MTARPAEPALTLPPAFPQDDYTPHGYLDNPHHTMVLNRSGVIRSVPPLGFGYWLRTFRGGYGTGTRGHVNYLSLLRMSVAAGAARFVTSADFAASGATLVSRYHTKNLVTYDWQHADLTYSLQFFLPREHTLACRVIVTSAAAAAQTIHVHASHVYGLWEQRWWGSDGVGMRFLPPADAAISAIWAGGDYFALGADAGSVAHKATADTAAWERWLRENDLSSGDTATVRGPGPLHTTLSYALTVPAGGTAELLVCLSRGANEPWALSQLAAARRAARSELADLLKHDAAFWEACPQLAGDWPEAWRRGWVYDWETLRMNVRRPVGIFKHPWDAMQVHSPRAVLGEAAVDMFALGHADPRLAQEVLLGVFADAPQPNVPCCREDGSMNMIAADGEACGTAPNWCFPFKVIRTLHALTGDDEWLRAIYPHLVAYVEWWLAHRADEHGWLHCHCDWESGQDGSKRFPEAEGAAADVVRTVDVEASLAEALINLAYFAQRLGDTDAVFEWTRRAQERTAATRAMFVDGWFRDFDTRTNRPILLPDYIDVMMLAPLTCGVATPEQIAAIRPRFQYFRDHPRPWLEWPSFFLAYMEAAWTAGLRLLAGEAVADVADRIYPRLDRRDVAFAQPDDPYAYRVPGVANEYWPMPQDVEPGGENYGWGATLPLHVIRGLMGFRESEHDHAAEFMLAPALPARLLGVGRRYELRGLHFHDLRVSIAYEVLSEQRLRVTLSHESPRALALGVLDEQRQTVLPTAPATRAGSVTFDVANGAVCIVTLAPDHAPPTVRRP